MTHPPLKIVLMKQLMLLLKALCLMLTKKTLFAIFSSEFTLILIHLLNLFLITCFIGHKHKNRDLEIMIVKPELAACKLNEI